MISEVEGIVGAGFAGVLLLVDGRAGVESEFVAPPLTPLGCASVFSSCILCRIGTESAFGGFGTGLKPFVAKPGIIGRLGYIGKPALNGPDGRANGAAIIPWRPAIRLGGICWDIVVGVDPVAGKLDEFGVGGCCGVRRACGVVAIVR
jgi:hypothetical protein